MKKIIIVALCLFLGIQSYSQGDHNPKLMETTNLFEYGLPINSAEANFRNLYKNFPILVSGDIKLLSNEFIQEIKNCKQAKIFLKKNSKLASLFPNILMGMNPSSPETSQIRMVFGMSGNSNAEKDRNEYLNLAKANCIDSPFLVYSIKLAVPGRTCNYYTFVDPKTNKIQLAGNFFGFSVPIAYAGIQAH